MTESDTSPGGRSPMPDFPAADDDEISLAELVAFFRRHFWWLGGGSVAGALMAGLVAWTMTPIYRAEVTVAPVSAESSGTLARLAGQLGPLAGVLGGVELGAGGSEKELALGTLKSRELLRQLIEEARLLPILFAERYDAAQGKWKVKNGRPLEPTLNEGIDRLSKQVFTITEDRRSGLVTVAAEWRDRQLAAEWANRLVALTNALLRQRAIDEARRNIAFLEQELEKTSVVERREIIYRLIESRTGEIMLAEGRPEFGFTIVDPARVPDERGYVRPKRVLMLVLGLIVGGLVTLVGIVLRRALTTAGATHDTEGRSTS